MPVRKVTDPSVLAQLNQGGVVAANPMFPGQMQGQQLNNAGQQLQNTERAVTLPYAAPKAAADASNAATQANVSAATAPAEIASKAAGAAKTGIEARAAQNNFAVTGGADNGQAKSASFYSRALRSNGLYEGTGIKDEPMGREVAKALLPDSWVNKYTSPQRQQAEAAQKDFIAATLRYESGANLPPSEFETQRQIFFPQPGDDPSTVNLKAQLRKNAIDGLRIASGAAAPLLEQSPQITASNPLPPIFGNNAAPQTATASTTMGQAAKAVIGGPTPSTQEFDPETSAAVDRLIRMGRPVGEILAFAKSRGYTKIDAPAVAAARLYVKRHPEYKGGFASATKSRPLTVGEAVSGSPLGAMGSAMGTAATAGFNDELAGGLNYLGGGDYTEGRDAFNAKKQLVADAHPYADFAGTALGTALSMGAAGKALQGTKLASAVQPAARYGQTAEEAARIGASRAATLGDLAYGGAFGAGENNENRGLGALEGIGAAGAGNMIGRAGATTLGALVSPTGGKLAPLYEMGVRPSIGQRFGGMVNNVEEKLKSIPVVGDAIEGTRSRARDQFQVGLFNDALGEIGQQLPKGMAPGHDPHAFAQKAFNRAYDSAKSNLTAVADGQLSQDIGTLQQAVGGLRKESQQQFAKLWKGSVARRFQDGVLSGPAFKDATSEIEKKIAAIRSSKTGDGELADTLQQAVDALHGSAMRNSAPEAVDAMNAVDRGYAKLVRLEDASKRAGGDAATFSPAQYNAAVRDTSGGIRKRSYLAGKALNTDLASAGLNLQDVVSNSGTVDRLVPAATLLGTSFLAPKSLLGLGAYGALNAPGVRNVTTNLLAPRNSARARNLADLIRKQSNIAGAIGSGTGIALLPSQ